MMIYTLNLPKPSTELVETVMHFAKQSKVKEDTIQWHQSIQNSNINCAYGDFFSKPEVTFLARKEFQLYFKKPLFPIIGVITNTTDAKVASYAPHTDRIRTIGINFYLELGGTNVQTVFYNEHDSPEDKAGGNVLPYEKVTFNSQFKFSNDKWYAIDTKQYHSVENIETSRILLTLSIVDSDFNEFKNLVSRRGFEPLSLV